LFFKSGPDGIAHPAIAGFADLPAVAQALSEGWTFPCRAEVSQNDFERERIRVLLKQD